jgi:hypothetical protein
MISWGVKVNEYGNAYLDENKEFVKISKRACPMRSGVKWSSMPNPSP